MSEMEERVARAITEARTPKGRELRGDDLALAVAYNMRESRAAIKVIFEGFYRERPIEGTYYTYYIPTAVIDAALEADK